MPVTDLWSWAAVIQKLEATSALGVISSNKCFSNVQKTAVASTRVGVHASQVSNTAADGSGKILFLQNLIISCWPVAVVDVSGGGGGWKVVKFVQASERVVMWVEQQQQERGSTVLAK